MFNRWCNLNNISPTDFKAWPGYGKMTTFLGREYGIDPRNIIKILARVGENKKPVHLRRTDLKRYHYDNP